MDNSQNNQTNKNLNELRADVTATTDALKVTVEKLVQRGENLDVLNNRAEDLSSTSYHFRGTARRVNRQMRWQNYKLTIFIVFVIVCILALIILMALHPWKK
ncbi:unnamed protein product [Adineta steineri]|uniref:V-SNARE coiled-coil homology domain-containing protein n=1 Tax=Adineta steineri TaxID=433720 RepID=A0A813T9C0_9BILA|nr:unnamed protein product [Adineta steineri]CAF0805180.1 unnamed protein product [Adineta steineri]CAF0900406.1 unnamed protein product [Adineta steineri]CAF0928927.1 unnamed protein product [Adineta steineri]CAF3646404.1 unnamed protein product [Adineta steineri]